MITRVLKNTRVSKCDYCRGEITTDYKVREKYDERETRGKYYHLTCYYSKTLREIKNDKEELRELHKNKRKLNKFKRYMILERL